MIQKKIYTAFSLKRQSGFSDRFHVTEVKEPTILMDLIHATEARKMVDKSIIEDEYCKVYINECVKKINEAIRTQKYTTIVKKHQIDGYTMQLYKILVEKGYIFTEENDDDGTEVIIIRF